MQVLRVLHGHDLDNSHSLETYRAQGGYGALAKALSELQPAQVTDEVYWSGLRGRGGAGFSTGQKWRFVPADAPGERYVVVNADEGEPGTFKDRYIMERLPHRMLEGILLTCYAIGARTAFIYLRGELDLARGRIIDAIDEARAAGFVGENVLGTGFTVDVRLYTGAGAYICGEETSLLNSLEGLRAEPRLKPPFPAQAGLYGAPTVVNNVETLANVPLIVERGAAWYREVGVCNPAVDAVGRGAGPPPGAGPDSAGTRVFCVSGRVNRPGIYEVPLGTRLSDLLELCGGMRPGLNLRAVIPGGSSAPMLGPEHFDVPLDFQSVADAGSMLGSGAVIYLDDRTCLVNAAINLTAFYHHESCGKCTPCREGSGWVLKVLRRIESGKGTRADLQLVRHVCDGIKGKCFCPLGESIPMPIMSAFDLYPEEWEHHVDKGTCMLPAEGN